MKRIVALIVLACSLLSFGKLPIEAVLSVSAKEKVVASSVTHISKSPKFNSLSTAEFENEVEDDLHSFSEFGSESILPVPFYQFEAYQIRIQRQCYSHYYGWKAPPAIPLFVVFCNYRL